MQVDDLLTFRQFSKKIADEAIDVSKPLSCSRGSLEPEGDGCVMCSTTKMSAGPPGLVKFRKTSFPISAVSPS